MVPSRFTGAADVVGYFVAKQPFAGAIFRATLARDANRALHLPRYTDSDEEFSQTG